MTEANAVTGLATLDDDRRTRLEHEVRTLAKRYLDASSPAMELVAFMGGKAESYLDRLPGAARRRLDDATVWALHQAYDAAARASGFGAIPPTGTWANKLAVAASGAAGGFGGLPTALLELPLTIATMFRTIQKVAEAHGFDPRAEDVRLECVRVFGSGGPLREDEGIDTSFVSARVLVNGAVLSSVLRTVAPRFAVAVGQKLAAQTIPVLGAVAGAGVNVAFITYFEQMARVRFGLMRLCETAGVDRVNERFRGEIADLRAQRRMARR